MNGISDRTMGAMSYALGGVAARADIRADNMANASTPGFQASTVKFEEALGAALASGGGSAEGLSSRAALQPVLQGGGSNALGNNVDFADEMTGGIKDNLLYEALVHGFNYKVGLLRSAVGRQA
jgi:flagellar basal-body rod protein FlgB